MADWHYEALRELVRGERLPVVLVDLDRFDANLNYFVERARQSGKLIRLASKSLRVPSLLRRAIDGSSGAIGGLMCYSAAEAAFLAEQGFDDLLLGYPTVQPADMALAAQAARLGRTITVMVDCVEHVERWAAAWNGMGIQRPLRICMDVDVSWRPLGLHIGAQRSPVRSIAALARLLDAISAQAAIQLVGVMTYEAHLAGLPDINPFARMSSAMIRMMKRLARPDVSRQRKEIQEFLARRRVDLEFANGGGTGSFEETVRQPWLTEVTVGSGLLGPHLFDYFASARRVGARQPAICFALPVARLPQADRATCHSFGYVASGPAGADRLPLPSLPEGLRIDPREGFGEVQTPLIVPKELRGKIRIGDPLFFRPAKAGELAEHFSQYHLFQNGQIVDRVPTYRGLGKAF